MSKIFTKEFIHENHLKSNTLRLLLCVSWSMKVLDQNVSRLKSHRVVKDFFEEENCKNFEK